MTEAMRAAWYDRAGPAHEVFHIGQTTTPAPEPGEVLVHIKASGINPSDYKRRGNAAAGSLKRMIPHSDGAGIVEQVGEGVSTEWIGKPVWLWNAVYRYGYAAPASRETGTAAEYVAIPVEFVAPLPAGVSFEIGACLGVPAFTAYAAVFSQGRPRQQHVLVQGGAGAVGELAVQFAASAGATVIATVSSEEKAGRARKAGAHHVVNYRENDVVEALATLAPDGVDKIIEVDFAANIRNDAAFIKPYGEIVSYSSTSNPEPSIPYYALQFKGALVRTVQVFTMPRSMRADAVLAINASLQAGVLRPTIADAFPLSDIASAHARAENRPDGNVVLRGSADGFLEHLWTKVDCGSRFPFKASVWREPCPRARIYTARIG